MRVLLIALISTLICSTGFAQWGDNYIKLSDKITTETKDITGFNKIDVSEDFEVYIHFSDEEEKVEIKANENLHELINVRQENGTLIIGTKSYSTNYGNGENSGAEEQLVAYITVKRLVEIKGDEDVVINLEDTLIEDKLTIDLSEDCIVNGQLDVKHLIVKLDEDSELDITGSAETMEVSAHEDSKVNGKDFIVGKLSIKLTEDSEAKLTVNGDIDLLAKEDSYFYYRGEGTFVRKRLRGDSEVKSW